MNTSISPQKILKKLKSSSLYPYIESYMAQRRSEGYGGDSLRAHGYHFRRFYQWLKRNHYSFKKINESVIAEFLKPRKPDARDGAPLALRRLLEILRDTGVTPPAEPAFHTPVQILAEEYRVYLQDERSFAPKTVANYTRYTECFLTERFGTGEISLGQLKLTEIIDFVHRTARNRNKIYTKGMVVALRSFLRYLHYRGKIDEDWAISVPAVAHWRLSWLPKQLPRPVIEKILDQCDQTTAVGRRDYAILLLLARLGLRGGEIVRMQLEDIDWAAGLLTVRAKKGRGWARMPLPSDVGKAIAQYLKLDRPTCASRNVFVRLMAPYEPLNNSASLGLRARAAFKKAGIDIKWKGSHVFRHSLGSEMLRRGSTLDEIGQVLRHHDHDTTAIYAKVDLTALRRLTIALPGGVL